MTDCLLLFIPCFNCRAQIGRVAQQLAQSDIPTIAQIMIVDNQSSDGTPEEAATAFSALRDRSWIVCRNRANYGLGGSHKVAFNYALENGFSHVIVLHGDDQARLTDFAGPVRDGLHHIYDSVLGARFMRGSSRQGYSAARTLGNVVLNALCGLLTRRWIYDQGSGLNIYKTSYLRSRFYMAFDDSLIFPNMMFFHGIWAKASHAFVPISWREEDQLSNAKAVRQALRVLRLVLAGPKGLTRPVLNPVGTDYPYDILYQGGAQ